MKVVHGASHLLAAGLFVLGLTLGAPAFAMTVAPGNPTVVVGQTQQFTTSGGISATTVAGGAYFGCMSRSDGTVQCWGRNNLGQLGDGDNTLGNSGVPVGVRVGAIEQLAKVAEHEAALIAI